MTSRALLLITTSYPQVGDGSEAAGAFVADIAEALCAHGPVRVVAPGHTATAPNECEHGPTIWRYDAGSRPLSLLSAKSPGDWLKIIRVLASMRRQALAASADGNVAHVLALWTLPSGWAARVVSRRHQTGYSVWALGSDIWSLGRLAGVRTLLRTVIRDAHACFADGYALARDAGRIGGRQFDFLPSTRAVRETQAAPVREVPPFRLLFLGRWHPNKGVDLLLDALMLLSDEHWRFIESITIAGGGPLDSVVRQGVERLVRDGRPVRRDGYLSPAEAAEAFANADWILIPSRIESIPVVLSDALKAGRPVIATAVGDMAEVVEGGSPCGIVANAPTPEAIATAIAKALEVGTYRYARGVANAAASFDLTMIASRLDDSLRKRQ